MKQSPSKCDSCAFETPHMSSLRRHIEMKHSDAKKKKLFIRRKEIMNLSKRQIFRMYKHFKSEIVKSKFCQVQGKMFIGVEKSNTISESSYVNLRLQWNNHKSNMVHLFRRLRDGSIFYDISLVCNDSDGKLFLAHKVILAALSNVFRELFDRDELDDFSTDKPLHLQGIPSKDLETILNLVYQGHVAISKECLQSFFDTAKHLKIEPLLHNLNLTSMNDDGKTSPTKEMLASQDDLNDGENISSNLSKETSFMKENNIHFMKTKNEAKDCKESLNEHVDPNTGFSKPLTACSAPKIEQISMQSVHMKDRILQALKKEIECYYCHMVIGYNTSELISKSNVLSCRFCSRTSNDNEHTPDESTKFCLKCKLVSLKQMAEQHLELCAVRNSMLVTK